MRSVGAACRGLDDRKRKLEVDSLLEWTRCGCRCWCDGRTEIESGALGGRLQPRAGFAGRSRVQSTGCDAVAATADQLTSGCTLARSGTGDKHGAGSRPE